MMAAGTPTKCLRHEHFPDFSGLGSRNVIHLRSGFVVFVLELPLDLIA